MLSFMPGRPTAIGQIGVLVHVNGRLIVHVHLARRREVLDEQLHVRGDDVLDLD